MSDSVIKPLGPAALILGPPQPVFRVSRGEVAVFAAPIQADGSPGARRHLGAIGPDGLLVPVRPTDGWLLLAVAVGEAGVSVLESDIDPADPGLAAWLQVLTAAAPDLQRRPDESLPGFQTRLLSAIARAATTDESADAHRFRQQRAEASVIAGAAITRLAAVLDGEATAPLPEGPPHRMAAEAVGRYLGVTIRNPAGWEDRRRDGEAFEAIARASRLRLRTVMLQGAWYRHDAGPLLGYRLENAAPVALLPEPHGGYRLIDPQQGESRLTPALAATIAPRAFAVYRPFPAGPLGSWDMVRFSMVPARRDLIIVAVASLGATLLGMMLPYATGLLIDQALPNADRPLLVQIAIGLIGSATGTILFQITAGLSLMRSETLAETATEAAVWDRLLHLRPPFFRQYASGDLASRVAAISDIRRRLSGTTLQTLLGAVFALMNFALLLAYSPSLSLLALVLGIGAMLVTAGFGALILRQMRGLRQAEGDLQGLVLQLIAGTTKLKVAGAQTRGFAQWAAKYTGAQRLRRSIQGLEDNLTVFDSLIPDITSLLLFAAVTPLIVRPDPVMSTGSYIAFSAAFGAFIGGITALGHTLDRVLNVVSLWERAKPILEAPPEVDERKTDPGSLSGSIRLESVSFRYRPDGPFVLKDLSLQIDPGSYVAIVGPSGSGKSTLLRLILGFEAPEFGKVTFDGQDLATLDLPAVRRQCGVVLQTSRVMAGSLFDNIAGGLVISLDDAWEAARQAGLAEDIEQMPMGMHTVVSEGGSNLSGGQRQRLLIARALALRPAIVLFDEATSALDNRTQAIVSASLDRLRVTRLTIAHRLSTIRRADRIYVVDNGALVETGTFESLMAADGLFARMMRRQMT